MSLFEEEFLAGISEEPLESAIAICNRVQQRLQDESEWTSADHEALLEGYALLQVMKEGGLLPPVAVDEPDPPTGRVAEDCVELGHYINNMRMNLEALSKVSTLEQLKSKFAKGLKIGFAYEFTQADLNRIQTLINELRDNIAASTLFEAEHQARLLKRLEQLQREPHKRVSDLDKFWGLIGDAGVALGRFGEAAKPFVERISEITQIVWNTQKQTEGLPSNAAMPLLTNPESSDTPEN